MLEARESLLQAGGSCPSRDLDQISCTDGQVPGEGLKVSFITSKGNDKIPCISQKTPGVSIWSSPADLTGHPDPKTTQMALACLEVELLLPSAILDW